MDDVCGDEDRKVQRLAMLFLHGMRRSCDACGRKKKRCDGQHPCNRCVRTETRCWYSKRRRHHPDPYQYRQQRQPGQSNLHAVREGNNLVHAVPGALLEHHVLPFKRCRLSASPATGLVGMQENAFLSDFFGCNGFLPLTDESQIRETVVKIMVPANHQQGLGCITKCFDEEGRFRALDPGSTFGNVCGMDHFPKDASMCTFWCAVAVGALAKGTPIDSVERYVELAREALEASRSDSTDTELVKASASLTYLHSFMGDREKLKESVTLSESFVRASVEHGTTDLRVGLPELIQHCKNCGYVQNESMDSSWVDEEAPPKWDEVTTEAELYRVVAQSFRAFDLAVYAKARERCADDLDHLLSGGFSNESPHLNDTLPWEMSEAIAAELGTDSCLKFEPLQETADRPSIRSGVGGLVINGALIFETATKGDLDSTLERLRRSVEVYERYPGLCRCMMGFHLSHRLLTTLVAIGDSRARSMYDRLRETYNSCHASHCAAIPPLEEWHGVADICGDLICRAIETLTKSEHMKAFKPPSTESTQDSAGLMQTAGTHDGSTKDENFLTDVARGESFALVPASPVNNGWVVSNATRNDSQRQRPARADYCAGITPSPPARPVCPSSQSRSESDLDYGSFSLSAKDVASSPMAAGPDGLQEGVVEPERDEIGASDWFQVAHALMDAGRVS